MSSQPIESKKKKSSCFSGDICDPAGNQEPGAIWEACVYQDLISCWVDQQTQYCSQRHAPSCRTLDGTLSSAARRIVHEQEAGSKEMQAHISALPPPAL